MRNILYVSLVQWMCEPHLLPIISCRSCIISVDSRKILLHGICFETLQGGKIFIYKKRLVCIPHTKQMCGSNKKLYFNGKLVCVLHIINIVNWAIQSFIYKKRLVCI